MSRLISVAGAFAVLLLAFSLLRIASVTEHDAHPRVPPGFTAAATPEALAASDPVAQAVDDLAAWPIAAASGR